MLQPILNALRSSEFWVVIAQATIEAVGAPVPSEVKAASWCYVAARVLSKAVKYIFPNGVEGSWFKHD